MTDDSTKSQLVKEREAVCLPESAPDNAEEPRPYLLGEALQENARLNEQLLDALPHPALLVHRDRTVLAANRMAREVGIKRGGVCWREFMGGQFISEEDKRYLAEHDCPPPGGSKCTFCLGDKALHYPQTGWRSTDDSEPCPGECTPDRKEESGNNKKFLSERVFVCWLLTPVVFRTLGTAIGRFR